MDKNNLQKDLYFVAVKVFLIKKNKLLILKDKFGKWDLVGGRIKKHEFKTSLKNVIVRKIKEELGGEVKYNLEDNPKIFMRHERAEVVLNSRNSRIFALGYFATFKTGEIKLSKAHTEMLWVDIKSFKPENFFTGGWLKGIKEFLVLKRK